MPRLVGGTGPGNVKADLYDPVVGSEHGFADRDKPRMRHNSYEATDPFRLYFDIPAFRSSRQRSILGRARFRKQRLDIRAHLVDEFGRKGLGQRCESITIDCAHDL